LVDQYSFSLSLPLRIAILVWQLLTQVHLAHSSARGLAATHAVARVEPWRPQRRSLVQTVRRRCVPEVSDHRSVFSVRLPFLPNLPVPREQVLQNRWRRAKAPDHGDVPPSAADAATPHATLLVTCASGEQVVDRGHPAGRCPGRDAVVLRWCFTPGGRGHTVPVRVARRRRRNRRRLQRRRVAPSPALRHHLLLSDLVGWRNTPREVPSEARPASSSWCRERGQRARELAAGAMPELNASSRGGTAVEHLTKEE